MAADWFRSTAWDDDARADFDRRLARARPDNRPQYLRVKALALRDVGETDEARRLLHRVIDEHRSSLDAPFAAELLGDMARGSGDLHEAAQWYRQTLDMRPDLNATSGQAHISLAEVLNEQGAHEEALRALGHVPPNRLGLNAARFRWNAALADAAAALGERVVAREAAARALALVGASDQFPRHPGVGRALATARQVERLRALSVGR